MKYKSFVCNMHGTLDILFVNVFKALFKITWCTKHCPTLFSNMWWQRRIYSASSASWQFLVTSLKAHLMFLSCLLGIIQNLSSVFYIPKPSTIEYRALFSCNAKKFSEDDSLALDGSSCFGTDGIFNTWHLAKPTHT